MTVRLGGGDPATGGGSELVRAQPSSSPFSFDFSTASTDRCQWAFVVTAISANRQFDFARGGLHCAASWSPLLASIFRPTATRLSSQLANPLRLAAFQCDAPESHASASETT